MPVFGIWTHINPIIVVAEEACGAILSQHVLTRLKPHHKGAILTLANWSGQWPRLVGMLKPHGSPDQSWG